ncbi:bile acid:sodium symporter family protein [Flavobacterium algicola]|uniref:bile acid:sodium symporter family protein n=1 Tax=Flavobacterium algicola TaxID=556529 RepID=UPI001EFD9ACD|nr:bile acid:sodium symporter family protein [Flavobacterium algicola]MCG9792359.1 bile acid:sodium symporter [Flavobacterium algicola]
MKKLLKILSKVGFDGFLLMIGAMILLAYFFPQPGMIKEPVSLEDIASVGVSFIFLFYGLRLSVEKLKTGLANWKMHIVVQLTTFLLFPLIVLALRPLFVNAGFELLWLGVFFLAALPSTVSSSVVMVSIAKGNIPAAIFNASISSLIGVVVTPLWVGLFIASATGNFDIITIVIKLIFQVLLPVIIGISLNSRFGAMAEKYKKQLKYFDQAIILTIIYTSFCKSFSENLFDSFTALELAGLATGMMFLFFVVFFCVGLISRLLGFSDEDRITVLFCGSKKSLVHGTVMSKVLFQHSSITGILLLPLMLYHALQLIAASIIAQRMARRKDE